MRHRHRHATAGHRWPVPGLPRGSPARWFSRVPTFLALLLLLAIVGLIAWVNLTKPAPVTEPAPPPKTTAPPPKTTAPVAD